MVFLLREEVQIRFISKKKNDSVGGFAVLAVSLEKIKERLNKERVFRSTSNLIGGYCCTVLIPKKTKY